MGEDSWAGLVRGESIPAAGPSWVGCSGPDGERK
jgi:hypothetical protein